MVVGRDRSETVDLDESPHTLKIEISDALSERDKIKFTVRTKSTLPAFPESEVSVVRQHEEFVWLHTMLEENEAYAGYIIPPVPSRPHFDASRAKLERLGESESLLSADEFNKLKAELESEYLATFKKTVAMHDIFLQRLAQHPVFSGDKTFHIFLSYDEDLSVRGKNKKERLAGLFSSIGRSADGLLLQTTQKDIDDSFDTERVSLTRYFDHVKDARHKSEKVSTAQRKMAYSFIRVSTAVFQFVALDMDIEPQRFISNFAEYLESARKIEQRISNDVDLKMTDVLRYYQDDSGAARDLLYRRLRALANYESANRNLVRARLKNKDIPNAESLQQSACGKFEDISTRAKQELKDLKCRRVQHFKVSLTSLAELQLKHSQSHIALLRKTIAQMKFQMVDEQS